MCRRRRPLLKLCDRLLLIGYLRDEDIQDLLVMIDHASWDPSYDGEGKDQHRSVVVGRSVVVSWDPSYDGEGKDQHRSVIVVGRSVVVS